MKYSEFRRWLIQRGAVITPSHGSHHKVTLNGRCSTFPDHGSKEISKGMVARIKRDLGLK